MGKTKKSQQQPAKIIRHGSIAASIWKRQAPSGFEYYDFSLSRSWKSQTTDREGYSPNFFSRNEDELKQTISEASAWIESKHACMQASLLSNHNETSEPQTIDINVA